MPFTAVRRDFIFENKCHKCSHELSSNIAVILRDEHGDEYAFGPECAKKALGHPVGPVPNLTAAVFKPLPPIRPRSDAPEATEIKAPRRRRSAEQIRMECATTYLLLRMRLLSRFPGVYYAPLAEAYQRYMDSLTLLPADVEHILRIEIFNNRNKPQFSLANLLTVYAFDRALTESLKHVPDHKQGFLLGMRKHLREHLFLSEGQVAGVASWLARIPRQTKLDANGFCWAWSMEDSGGDE